MTGEVARGRHVALIVEDDPLVATVLALIVESLGHEVVQARTLEEASRAIETRALCYALVDLQIPPREGMDPSVGCGMTVLRLLRERFTARTSRGKHRFAAIVVSSYTRDPEFVSKLFEDYECDVFLAKPIDARHEVVVEKIRRALERGESADHAACAARAASVPQTTSERACEDAPNAEQAPVRVVLDGQWRKRRTGFLVNGERRDLQDAHFIVFLGLVVARLKRPGLWTSFTELGCSGSREIVSRINRGVCEGLGEGVDVAETNGDGGARLYEWVIVEGVEWGALAKHPHPRVRQIAEEMRGEA